MSVGFEANTKFIPAHQQASSLIELGLSRGLHPDRLLRGSGVFLADLESPNLLLSSKQLLKLYQNFEKLSQEKELAFLYGQYLLPGYHAVFSSALLTASNTQEALTLLEDFSILAFPLMQIRLQFDNNECFVHCLPSDGDDYQSRFLVEAVMAALVSVCRLLGGTNQDWRFLLAFEQPNYPEQYQVQLGENTRFNAHINGIFIPRDSLLRPWPRGLSANFSIAREACDKALLGVARESLVLKVYAMLRAHIRQPPGLEQLAHQLELSPASLKRKLKDFDCSYQQLLDSARRHFSVYCIETQGLSAEQLAERLNYHDKHNFKRSFKRWTGLTPAAYSSE